LTRTHLYHLPPTGSQGSEENVIEGDDDGADVQAEVDLDLDARYCTVEDGDEDERKEGVDKEDGDDLDKVRVGIFIFKVKDDLVGDEKREVEDEVEVKRTEHRVDMSRCPHLLIIHVLPATSHAVSVSSNY